ncbi:MAG: DUF1759 domain-containing protein, partial [Candidatus Acidiferrales bacterium]
KRLEKIELLWDQYISIQGQIEILDDSDVQKTDLERELNIFEPSYFDALSRAQDKIDASKVTGSNTNQIQNISQSSFIQQSLPQVNVKLPPLNLPSFSGSYHDYMQFNDIFDSLIDKNQFLSKVQKFYYLKSCLIGDAQKIIQSLEVTEQNYDIAKDLLKERYENKRIIINSHLKSFFELPVIQKESSQGLRNFLDTFLKDFRSLKNLGQPVDQWDSILIYVLTSKLDFNSKREWENSIKDNTLLPTIDDFTKFLNSRCQLLETIYIKASCNESNKGIRGNNYQLNHVSTQNKLKCYFCRENHCLYYCQKFLNLTPQNRIKEVNKLNLCNNCLRTKHTDQDICKGQCKKCGKAHNTLLHVNSSHYDNSQNQGHSNSNFQGQQTFNTLQDQPLQSNFVNNSNNSSENSINTHCSNQFAKTSVLLGTAEIFIKDSTNNFLKCRALLDGGSQSNFITKNLAEKLQIKTNKSYLPIIGIGGNQTGINHNINTEVKSMHNNFQRNLTFLIIDRITNNIPQVCQEINNIQIPDNIILADPNFMVSRQVDVLLGATIFYSLLSNNQIKLGKNMPMLTETFLGWVIAGPLQVNTIKSKQTCML